MKVINKWNDKLPNGKPVEMGQLENGMHYGKIRDEFTAGPWQTAGTVNGYQYEIWPVAGTGIMVQKICSVNFLHHDDNRADREEGYDNSEAEANARLIAAAPEMYNLCRATRKALAMQIYETGKPGTWATLLDDMLAEVLTKIEGV